MPYRSTGYGYYYYSRLLQCRRRCTWLYAQSPGVSGLADDSIELPMGNLLAARGARYLRRLFKSLSASSKSPGFGTFHLRWSAAPVAIWRFRYDSCLSKVVS
ncbi:hypothetical protein T05_6353 [Trichinella murrelli]|uniref:Uncharacterized protein n=1 Tax=Trichinella murrelli TaxID=144512 RepID=A0A0V0UCG4_9BILA|nr:hypothetical protein T05_6353 [Trichinella murrelli]